MQFLSLGEKLGSSQSQTCQADCSQTELNTSGWKSVQRPGQGAVLHLSVVKEHIVLVHVLFGSHS